MIDPRGKREVSPCFTILVWSLRSLLSVNHSLSLSSCFFSVFSSPESWEVCTETPGPYFFPKLGRLSQSPLVTLEILEVLRALHGAAPRSYTFGERAQSSGRNDPGRRMARVSIFSLGVKHSFTGLGLHLTSLKFWNIFLCFYNIIWIHLISSVLISALLIRMFKKVFRDSFGHCAVSLGSSMWLATNALHSQRRNGVYTEHSISLHLLQNTRAVHSIQQVGDVSWGTTATWNRELTFHLPQFVTFQSS